MVRSTIYLALTLSLIAAPAEAASCTALAAPTINGCTKVPVAGIAKAFLDLYKIDGGKAVLNKSVKSEDICKPFEATDCNVAAYLMIETPEKERLLFRRSDLRKEASDSDCICPHSAQNTVIGAPGAGKLKECAPEQCR